MINYIIAVDGGGTKTVVACIDSLGNLFDKVVTGPGSAAVISESVIWDNILKAIDELITKLDNNYALKGIVMGLSAFSIFEEISSIKDVLNNKYHVPVVIEGDTLIALHSVLKDNYQNGVVVVAGTGIAIFGKNDNESCIIGGWGHIIRELGSAYAAVHHFALNIIDNMENGFLLTTLENDFLDLLHKNNIKDLKHLFYFHSKNEVASYVTFIKERALLNDLEAKELLKQEGKYLGYQIIKAINKLNLKTNYVIGLRGGFVQKQNQDIIDGIKEVLNENKISAPLISDSLDPIYGCYFLAKMNELI